MGTSKINSFVIKNAENELKSVCMNGLKERFGKNPPEAVKNRLIHELDVVSKNHHATYYLLASKLAKEAERLHQVMMIRGVFTSSLTAYTSGISDINPMEKEYGGINLPFESTCEEYAVKEPCLDIQCSVAFIQFAQVFLYKEFPEYRQIIYPLKSEGDYGIRAVRLYLLKPEKMPDIKSADADKCNPESFFDYMFLQGFFHITFINDISMELMRNSRYSDLDFDLDKGDLGVSIADLWKYSQKMDGELRDFRKLKVKTYEELIKVKSMAYSTDVWDGLLKEMVLDKRLPLSDVIGSREDLFDYLIKIGFDRQEAFYISNRVRRGKHLTDEQLRELKAHGVEEWVIELCGRVQYLFPKAHIAQMIRRDAFCLRILDRYEEDPDNEQIVTLNGFI